MIKSDNQRYLLEAMSFPTHCCKTGMILANGSKLAATCQSSGLRAPQLIPSSAIFPVGVITLMTEILHDLIRKWHEPPVCRSPTPLFSKPSRACCGPSVTNLCRGPLCRVLLSSIGLAPGGFVARRRDSVTSLVRKRPIGHVANPMLLGRSHIPKP